MAGNPEAEASRRVEAGAFAIDITPAEFPVIVNGGMFQRTADKVVDPWLRIFENCSKSI